MTRRLRSPLTDTTLRQPLPPSWRRSRFVISMPFQAEDVFLNKLNLRSVQTESFPLPETPLAAEFSANIAKITAFKRKVFGDAARGRHRPSSHHRPRVSKGKEVMAPVFEYVSDEEHHEMVFIESEEESDTDTVENMKCDRHTQSSFCMAISVPQGYGSRLDQRRFADSEHHESTFCPDRSLVAERSGPASALRQSPRRVERPAVLTKACA